MKTILFASAASPFLPVLAAAAVARLGFARVRAEAAAGDPDHDPAVRRVAALGLAWPLKVHALTEVVVPAYDLVVCFADPPARPLFAALPGNPAQVLWRVAGPEGDDDPAADQALWQRIRELVGDLVGQGYLAALAQARRDAELVMDNLSEGVLAHDRQRRIFFFNRAAERITGFSRREVLGCDCHQIFPEGFCKSRCSFCASGEGEPSLPDKPYPLELLARDGATRYLEMNVIPLRDLLGALVGVVASFRDFTREHDLAARLGEADTFAGLIGRDPKMVELFRAVADLAGSRVAVLLSGESGTGKELVAAAIHSQGRRAGKLFVPVNCGALPEHLLESELFGHVRGAFTGAVRDKKGRFELADGGTLFLDEIGDISPAMQVKLLRVLQDGTFQRVGGESTITVDVRVISATHKDLRAEIAAGRFREDLFYRLCVVPLVIPPLRERPGDIPLLVRHFLTLTLAEEGRGDRVVIGAEAMDRLCAYPWPGNVRELQNVIRFALVHCREELLKPAHLPPQLLREAALPVRVAAMAGVAGRRRGKLSVEAVQAALAATGGNRLQAARHLGVGRATLYRFLAKHPVS